MKEKCIKLYKYNAEQVKEIVEVLEALGDTIYDTTRRRVTDKRKFPLSSNRSECNTLLYTNAREGWTGYGNYHSLVKYMDEIEYEEILQLHPKFNSKIKFQGKLLNFQMV